MEQVRQVSASERYVHQAMVAIYLRGFEDRLSTSERLYAAAAPDLEVEELRESL